MSRLVSKWIAPGLLCLLLSGSALGAGLKACVPDYQSVPFTSPAGEAPAQRVVAMAMQRLGIGIEFLTAPWARCVAGIGNAQYDLILGVEADQDLLPTIAYPERLGKPDAERRLGLMEYVLVQKAGASAESFSHLKQPIIVPSSGYQAMRRLRGLGAAIKTMNYDASRFLSMLCHDRAEVIVLRRNDFGASLTACQPSRTMTLQTFSLAAPDVYLGIRRSLLLTQPMLGESIWREVDRIKASASWPVEMLTTMQLR